MEHTLLLLEQYRYLILFPLAAVEGPIVALLAGFLVYLGYIDFIPAYIIMLFGDIIPDVIYYYIGRFGSERGFVEKYSKKKGFIFRNLKLIESLWRDHGQKTMFFGKLAYGLSIPFLMSAGLIKMPLRKFLQYTIPATLFQYGLIMAAGYLLGPSYAVAATYIKNVGIVIAILLAIFVALYVLMSKYAYKKIVTLEKEEEKVVAENPVESFEQV